MPINEYSKEVFDEAPVKTKLGMLFIMNLRIIEQLDKHPTNCDERFFAMEKDTKFLLKRKTIDSVIAIFSAIGISVGMVIAFFKGWAPFK